EDTSATPGASSDAANHDTEAPAQQSGNHGESPQASTAQESPEKSGEAEELADDNAVSETSESGDNGGGNAAEPSASNEKKAVPGSMLSVVASRAEGDP